MARIFTKVSLFIVAASLLAACAAATSAPAAQITSTAPAVTATTGSSPATPTTSATITSATPAATTGTPAATTDVSATTGGANTAAGATAPAAKAGDRTFQIFPAQSDASYEVTEKFLNRSLPNQAIGKTNSIQGTVVINTTGTPSASIPKMTVDLSTLTSDQSRRDNMIRNQWLNSNQYPLATFVSTGVQGAPASYTDGQEVSFKLTGNLTIHDTTKPVTFDVKAKLTGSTLTGTATTQILMKDFGFDPPDLAGMLTVTDGVKVTVNFTANEVK